MTSESYFREVSTKLSSRCDANRFSYKVALCVALNIWYDSKKNLINKLSVILHLRMMNKRTLIENYVLRVPSR